MRKLSTVVLVGKKREREWRCNRELISFFKAPDVLEGRPTSLPAPYVRWGGDLAGGPLFSNSLFTLDRLFDASSQLQVGHLCRWATEAETWSH